MNFARYLSFLKHKGKILIKLTLFIAMLIKQFFTVHNLEYKYLKFFQMFKYSKQDRPILLMLLKLMLTYSNNHSTKYLTFY